MAENDQEPKRNDARQSSADDLALGQDERDFGAGGQDGVSTGATEQRDTNRDSKLDDAGESAGKS